MTLIFLVLNWLPGDPAELVAGDSASAETVEHLRVQLGTDRSIGRQYREYLGGLLRGDLGRSYVTREPVLDRLVSQLSSTLIRARPKPHRCASSGRGVWSPATIRAREPHGTRAPGDPRVSETVNGVCD